MVNERKTEQILRNILRDKGYFDDDTIVVSEQSTDHQRIASLLRQASKSRKGKRGYPDFIISFKNKVDVLLS